MPITSFLQKLTAFLFQPVFSVFLAGIVVALLLNWKKRGKCFWLLTSGLIFMLLWRWQAAIISKRYMSIFIYPAVIFSVYFCYAFPSRLSRLFRRRPRIRRVLRSVVPPLLVAILCFICLVKVFRVNPYEGHLREACTAIRADAAGDTPAMILEFCGEEARLNYYSGLKVISGKEGLPATDIADLKRNLDRYRFLNLPLYLVFYEAPDAPPLSDRRMELPPERWTAIFSSYTNRKGRRKLSAYRYRPDDGGAIRKISGTEPAETLHPRSDNQLVHGGFEEKIDAEEYPTLASTFQLRGFRLSPETCFPRGWHVRGLSGFPLDRDAVVELAAPAISGEYSLRLAAGQPIICYNAQYFPGDRWQVTFLAQGKPGTRFALILYFHQDAYSVREISIPFEFALKTSGVYRYSIPLDLAGPGDELPFRLGILLRQGELVIDEISLKRRAVESSPP